MSAGTAPTTRQRDDLNLTNLIDAASGAYDLATSALADLATVTNGCHERNETLQNVMRDVGRAAYWTSYALFEAARLGGDVHQRYLIGTYLDRNHPDYEERGDLTAAPTITPAWDGRSRA